MPARFESPPHRYPPGAFDLRKKVFSWSCYNTWHNKGKVEFYDKYIMRGADYINPRMMAGRIVDDAFSKDEEPGDKMLQHLRTFAPTYDYAQYEIEVPFNGLTLVMHLDGLTLKKPKLDMVFPPEAIIGETKTGSINPASWWTQQRAEKWEQLDWYFLGVHQKFGIAYNNIKAVLTWIPMDWKMDELMPRPTGDIQNFEVEKDSGSGIDIGKKIMNTWTEIEKFAKKEYEDVGL